MKVLLVIALLLLNLNAFSQNALSSLNGFKYVFLPQLKYNDGSQDKFGVRKIVKDQLLSSGFEVIEGDKIPEYIQDPCLVSWCSIETTNNGYQAASDYVYIKFYDCQKSVVYSSQGATGAVVMTIQSGWRNAAKKAVSGFVGYSHKFDENESIESKFAKNLPKVEVVSDNEESLKKEWNSNKTESLEGIYKSLQDETTQHYRIAIKRQKDKLIAIVLESDSKFWKPGEVKAYFEQTSSNTVFSTKWLMGNKTSVETFSVLENGALLTVDLTNPETGAKSPLKFIKLYPSSPHTVSSSTNVTATGSGFFVSGDGIVATNSHVVGNSSKIEILVPQEGKPPVIYKAKILIQDKANDIALLKIDDDKFKVFNDIPYSIVEKTNTGDNIFTIGYPLSSIMGTNYKVSNGIVSAQSGIEDDVRFLQITAPLQPGNSGGPLFNKDGNIVGITSAKLNENAVGVGVENVSYAIKSSYLIFLYGMLPNAGSINRASKMISKDLSQQVKQLKNYVCLIQVY